MNIKVPNKKCPLHYIRNPFLHTIDYVFLFYSYSKNISINCPSMLFCSDNIGASTINRTFVTVISLNFGGQRGKILVGNV